MHFKLFCLQLVKFVSCAYERKVLLRGRGKLILLEAFIGPWNASFKTECHQLISIDLSWQVEMPRRLN